MTKHRTVRFIAAAVLVGVIVVLGYYFHLSRVELTPERVKRILFKYEAELVSVAEYVSRETRLYRYYGNENHSSIEYYQNADFLPRNIKKHMSLYFNKVAKKTYASIYRICDESVYYFNISDMVLQGETGAIFYLRSSKWGTDSETGSSINMIQHLIYLKSDNPRSYLKQIYLGKFDSIVQIADKWYLVSRQSL